MVGTAALVVVAVSATAAPAAKSVEVTIKLVEPLTAGPIGNESCPDHAPMMTDGPEAGRFRGTEEAPLRGFFRTRGRPCDAASWQQQASLVRFPWSPR